MLWYGGLLIEGYLFVLDCGLGILNGVLRWSGRGGSGNLFITLG